MSYPQENFTKCTISPNSLIGRRREACQTNALPYQLQVLKTSGRYNAFKLGWHPIYDVEPYCWPILDHQFWDSDIAKWIEGACYFMHERKDHAIESAIEELVQMIRSAQQPDGYLNIHYTVVDPGKRFTNFRDMHELYNAGHLIEAALAHHALYGNESLLEPILKYVDLLCEKIGPDDNQLHAYPGHPEIELALLRLFDRMKNPKHAALAKYFISERGNPNGMHGQHFYRWEAKQREEPRGQRPEYWTESECLWYYQAHKPIAEQTTIEGHSVRAMYLLTAVADLVKDSDKKDCELRHALYRLWDNMVQKRMYVTGGIGAIKSYEGFSIDYFLPQGTDEGGCYAETCAGIGVMMLAERILQFDLDRRFSDVLELCLYNAVLTGMSCDGKAFTYVNQLASCEKDISKRKQWFTCACCPPNMLRLLASISGYIYSQTTPVCTSILATVNIHLYITSKYTFEAGGEQHTIEQSSNYPWDGKINFTLDVRSPHVQIKLRIPHWAQTYKIIPLPPDAMLENGYLTLSGSYLVSNPSFSLVMPIQPRLLASHPLSGQSTLSIARGPIIYCVEDVDNPWVRDHFRSLHLSPKATFAENSVTDAITGEQYVGLTCTRAASTIALDVIAHDVAVPWTAVEQAYKAETVVENLHFIPYYFRANRGGSGQMRVGLRRRSLSCESRADIVPEDAGNSVSR